MTTDPTAAQLADLANRLDALEHRVDEAERRLANACTIVAAHEEKLEEPEPFDEMTGPWPERRIDP